MTTEESLEVLGQQIDTLESLLCALKMPVPAHLHVAGLKSNLPDVVAELKRVYINETGNDPWGRPTSAAATGSTK